MSDRKEKIWQTAVETLDIEMAALAALKGALDVPFVQAVEAIFASQGRLIITGIGKSAIVAQKIVATLNSTGTPSVFMHAADAIHGDLGIIQKNDVVLCLSKSGDTPEIKVLVPLLKNTGNILIAMVANRQSFLGQQADFVLHTPIEKEADPNNLAPTASTTAQMALGDAIATALLALRGFTAQHFAQFHPGGALGKQLYLRVNSIYPQHDTPSVGTRSSLQQTILEMTSKRLGATAVLDDSGAVVGIVTDGDLRRLLSRGDSLQNVCAADIMSKNPITIAPDTLAVDALQLLRQRSISQLIVADGNQYLGMVHLHDLLKEGIV